MVLRYFKQWKSVLDMYYPVDNQLRDSENAQNSAFSNEKPEVKTTESR